MIVDVCIDLSILSSRFDLCYFVAYIFCTYVLWCIVGRAGKDDDICKFVIVVGDDDIDVEKKELQQDGIDNYDDKDALCNFSWLLWS